MFNRNSELLLLNENVKILEDGLEHLHADYSRPETLIRLSNLIEAVKNNKISLNDYTNILLAEYLAAKSHDPIKEILEASLLELNIENFNFLSDEMDSSLPTNTMKRIAREFLSYTLEPKNTELDNIIHENSVDLAGYFSYSLLTCHSRKRLMTIANELEKIDRNKHDPKFIALIQKLKSEISKLNEKQFTQNEIVANSVNENFKILNKQINYIFNQAPIKHLDQMSDNVKAEAITESGVAISEMADAIDSFKKFSAFVNSEFDTQFSNSNDNAYLNYDLKLTRLIENLQKLKIKFDKSIKPKFIEYKNFILVDESEFEKVSEQLALVISGLEEQRNKIKEIANDAIQIELTQDEAIKLNAKQKQWRNVFVNKLLTIYSDQTATLQANVFLKMNILDNETIISNYLKIHSHIPMPQNIQQENEILQRALRYEIKKGLEDDKLPKGFYKQNLKDEDKLTLNEAVSRFVISKMQDMKKYYQTQENLTKPEKIDNLNTISEIQPDVKEKLKQERKKIREQEEQKKLQVLGSSLSSETEEHISDKDNFSSSETEEESLSEYSVIKDTDMPKAWRANKELFEFELMNFGEKLIQENSKTLSTNKRNINKLFENPVNQNHRDLNARKISRERLNVIMNSNQSRDDLILILKVESEVFKERSKRISNKISQSLKYMGMTDVNQVTSQQLPLEKLTKKGAKELLIYVAERENKNLSDDDKKKLKEIGEFAHRLLLCKSNNDLKAFKKDSLPIVANIRKHPQLSNIFLDINSRIDKRLKVKFTKSEDADALYKKFHGEISSVEVHTNKSKKIKEDILTKLKNIKDNRRMDDVSKCSEMRLLIREANQNFGFVFFDKPSQFFGQQLGSQLKNKLSELSKSGEQKNSVEVQDKNKLTKKANARPDPGKDKDKDKEIKDKSYMKK